MAKMTYEESIESLDARIEQLRARRRDEIAKHERRERLNCTPKLGRLK